MDLPGVVRSIRDVPLAMLLKAIVVAVNTGAAMLLWRILGYVRPADQLFGTLVYLWNRVVLMKFAAEGHNDAVMILGVLAALLLSVDRAASAVHTRAGDERTHQTSPAGVPTGATALLLGNAAQRPPDA